MAGAAIPGVLSDIPDIKAIDDFPGRPRRDDEKPLRNRLLIWYVDHAREVREFEAATRELLVGAAQISGALENLKLQSFVRWVSILALLVAIVALVVSGVGVAHELNLLGATRGP